MLIPTNIDVEDLVTSKSPLRRKHIKYPRITYTGAFFYIQHSEGATPTRCFVRLTENDIEIGCTSITPQAAEHVIDTWRKNFKSRQQIVEL